MNQTLSRGDSDYGVAEHHTVDYGVTAELYPPLKTSLAIMQSIAPYDAREHAAGRHSNGETDGERLSRAAAAAGDSRISGDRKMDGLTVDIGCVLRDRYVIESRLGMGGMGSVFKATDRFRGDLAEANRHVAIKILHDEIYNRPDVFSKLRREFYCAQTLSHRNIVRVYELDQDADVAFFTMEFLEGELLSRVIEKARPNPLPRAYAWNIIKEVGAALTHAHLRNVVHADLKPQNIMITKSGDVRLLDFGTSNAAAHQQSAVGAARNNSTAVTPAYASVELLDGQAAEPADDLYAFACLAYELLTGSHPFGHRRSTQARELGLIPERPAGLSRRQWKALSMGLSWERQDRAIAIPDWVAKLNPETTFLDRSVRTLNALSRRRPPVFTRAALLTVLGLTLLSGTAWWTWHERPSAASSSQGAAALSPATVSTPSAEPASSTQHSTDLAPDAAAAPPAVAQRAAGHSTATPGTVTQLTPAANVVMPSPTTPNVKAANARTDRSVAPATVATGKAVRRGGVPAASRSADPARIGFAANAYHIRAGERFAEVRVNRTLGSDRGASFVWWTEAGSAQSGVDFMPQSRTPHVFSNGVKTASLFVKILPNTARQSPRQFYIVLGTPSAGNSLARISRIPVLLAPSR